MSLLTWMKQGNTQQKTNDDGDDDDNDHRRSQTPTPSSYSNQSTKKVHSTWKANAFACLLFLSYIFYILTPIIIIIITEYTGEEEEGKRKCDQY